MRNRIVQNIIDYIRRKDKKLILTSIHPKTTKPFNKKVVAVDGFYYSGSGALVELLTEFDNITCSSDKEVYPENFKKTRTKEINFFTSNYSIFNLYDAFNKSELERDLAVKRFIYYIYESYNNEHPMFYNEKFIEESHSFLNKILDLDNDTSISLINNKFPYVIDKNNDIYNNLNFVYGNNDNKYIFYRFKNISFEEFTQHIADYIYTFFNSVESKEILVCDQLFSLSSTLQNKLNHFMNEYPVKEICVYRDPRDQFTDAFAHDIDYLPRKVDKYIKFYQTNIQKIKIDNPYRISIRFEDLCTNYEKTLNKVCSFLDIDAKNHINKKQVFNPEISIKNVGIYKQFFDKKFMDEIKQNLSEYCYDDI